MGVIVEKTLQFSKTIFATYPQIFGDCFYGQTNRQTNWLKPYGNYFKMPKNEEPSAKVCNKELFLDRICISHTQITSLKKLIELISSNKEVATKTSNIFESDSKKNEKNKKSFRDYSMWIWQKKFGGD